MFPFLSLILDALDHHRFDRLCDAYQDSLANAELDQRYDDIEIDYSRPNGWAELGPRLLFTGWDDPLDVKAIGSFLSLPDPPGTTRLALIRDALQNR